MAKLSLIDFVEKKLEQAAWDNAVEREALGNILLQLALSDPDMVSLASFTVQGIGKVGGGKFEGVREGPDSGRKDRKGKGRRLDRRKGA